MNHSGANLSTPEAQRRQKANAGHLNAERRRTHSVELEQMLQQPDTYLERILSETERLQAATMLNYHDQAEIDREKQVSGRRDVCFDVNLSKNG